MLGLPIFSVGRDKTDAEDAQPRALVLVVIAQPSTPQFLSRRAHSSWDSEETPVYQMEGGIEELPVTLTDLTDHLPGVALLFCLQPHDQAGTQSSCSGKMCFHVWCPYRDLF